MNKTDFLKDLNEIEDSFLQEAEPKETKFFTGSRIFRAAAVTAAVVLLALGLASWMKSPKNRISAETSATDDTAKEETSVPNETVEDTSVPNPVRTEATEETEADPALLYEDAEMIVREITAVVSGSPNAEACLMYLTEKELFEKCDLVLRARITDMKNISLENKKMGWTEQACILTAEPLDVIRGQLEGSGPVRIFLNRYLNSSLADLNLSLRSAAAGREGILMLYKNEYTGYMEAIADYTVGDNQRFAIWANESGGLSLDRNAFPGISQEWDLNQAESYVREILDDNRTAPEDFAFSVRFDQTDMSFDGIDRFCYSYDSRDGSYSLAGLTDREALYGADNVSTKLEATQDFLKDAYYSCRRLNGLPEDLSISSDTAKMTWEIELCWTAGGEEHRVYYSGPVLTILNGNLEKLIQSETEIRHYLEELPSMRSWTNGLENISEARRLERSKEIAAALEAAFAARGGAPAYYRGMEFAEGGYLQIWLEPAESDALLDQYIREIQEMLSGFDGEYLFAAGDGPGTE